jgi:hypothetical protein
MIRLSKELGSRTLSLNVKLNLKKFRFYWKNWSIGVIGKEGKLGRARRQGGQNSRRMGRRGMDREILKGRILKGRFGGKRPIMKLRYLR